MKSYRQTLGGLAALAFGLWVIQGVVLAQLPESAKNPEIQKELDIFASVIKDTLTEKGIARSAPPGNRSAAVFGIGDDVPGIIGRSVFDWDIQTQYIPTVRAIFTIPVSFPLVNPEKKTEKTEPEGAEPTPQDLWEKHEKAAQSGPGPAFEMNEMMLPGMPGPADISPALG